jgi:N utilization substance protein A
VLDRRVDELPDPGELEDLFQLAVDFAPLPPEEEMAGQVPLSELKGLSPDLTGILESAGYKMLNDILDLEREDIAKVPGMTPETSDQLMAFLSELTDEEGSEDTRPKA